ncbi:MAG: hypothetical protein OXN17_00165 [Candidatus Poribacteria bacterium]|nr:hypothetical protein [Candidatus Poribacteria bacterium]MDE0506297.1 hypothetical protein [Candidatus Poribacteria bacterium]
MLTRCINTIRRSERGRFDWFGIFALLVSALVLIPTVAVAQDQVSKLAIVANGLTKPEADIFPSLSIVNLDEPDAGRAVADEEIPLGDIIPSDLVAQENLLYVVTQIRDPFFDPRGGYVEVIDLLTHSTIEKIAIESDTTPKQIAIVESSKAYVTGLYSDKVDVVDLNRHQVIKRISVGQMPDGITVLNGKAYVANSAYSKEKGTWNISYDDNSSVTVIDTATDTVLKTIPMPINTSSIANDGESSVIAVSGGVGDWIVPGGIPGTIAIIDTVTDEIVDTVDLEDRAGNPAVDSMKRLFISSGGLLVYDLVNGQWLHGVDNPFSDLGGVGAIDQDDNLYITKADWTGGGMDELYVVSPNAVLLNTYRVGHGASGVALAQVETLLTAVSPQGKLAISWGKLKTNN